MRNIFNILPELTVSISAMIIMIIAVRAVFAPKLNSKMLAYLWLLVLVRLLIPYTIESPLHIDTLFPEDKANAQISEQSSARPDTSSEAAINIYPYDLPEEYPASPDAQANKTKIFENVKRYAGSMPVKDIAFAIWLAGIVFMLVRQSVLAIFFFRKTGYLKCIKDAYLEAQLKQLCKKLKVKKHIEIIKSRHVNMPVTAGILHPKIIIPAALSEKFAPEKLKLIIMHELCHIKRRDTLKNIFWMAAKTVYWFNPLVWAANKLYLDDAELFCDEQVKKNIDREESVEYSQTLVDVARFSKKADKAIFISPFSRGKSNLRKRVRYMISPTKKTNPAMVLTFILSLIIFAACFTTACQPSPEENVVAKKDNAEEMILKAAEEEKNEAPDETVPKETAVPNNPLRPNVYEVINHVEDRYPVNGNEDFVFDADVYMPVTDTYPVVKISPVDFSDETANAIMDYFFAGCGYVKGTPWAKSYYEQAIIDLKAEMANPDPDICYQDGYFELALQRLKEEMDRAPETLEYEDSVNALSIEGGGYDVGVIKDGVLQGYIEADKNRIRANVLSGLEHSGRDYLLKTSDGKKLTVYDEEYVDATQFNMSEDEAFSACNALLESWGIDYLVPTQITKEYFYEKQGRAFGSIVQGGYKVEYGQPLGAISPAKVSPFRLDIDKSLYEYIPPIEVEHLSIIIDDTGNIVSFRWDYPSQRIEKMVEDVDILPFDEMLEKAKAFTRIKYGYNNETSSSRRGYIVGSIGLYSYYLPIKDNLHDCMYAPCWVFEYKYAERIENGAGDSASEFLIFNAIDGAPVSVVTTRELESLYD